MPSNYTLNIGKMSILLHVFTTTFKKKGFKGSKDIHVGIPGTYEFYLIWQINNIENMIKLRVFRWGDFSGYYHSGPKRQSHVAF